MIFSTERPCTRAIYSTDHPCASYTGAELYNMQLVLSEPATCRIGLTLNLFLRRVNYLIRRGFVVYGNPIGLHYNANFSMPAFLVAVVSQCSWITSVPFAVSKQSRYYILQRTNF